MAGSSTYQHSSLLLSVQILVHRLLNSPPHCKEGQSREKRKAQIDRSTRPAIERNHNKRHHDRPKPSDSRAEAESLSPDASFKGLSGEGVKDRKNILHEEASNGAHGGQGGKSKSEMEEGGSCEEDHERMFPAAAGVVNHEEGDKQAG